MLATPSIPRDDPERGSLRDALRSATRDVHAALDAHVSLVLGDRPAYEMFLRSSHRAVAGLEGALLRLGIPSSVVPVARAHLIAQDLATLSAAPPRDGALAWVPRSLAEGYGAAYVIEGSSLGGQVLARRVVESLGVDATATRYLRLNGDSTADRWRVFLGELERWGTGASPAHREAAEVAARATFGVFLEAFQAEHPAGTR